MDFTEESTCLQIFFSLQTVQEVNPTLARDTDYRICSEQKAAGSPTKGTVFYSPQPSAISLGRETRCSSQDSTTHQGKLLDIDFIFLPGRSCLPRHLPRQPCDASSCGVPCGRGGTALPSRMSGEGCPTSPLQKAAAAPALTLGAGVKHQLSA